MFTTEQAVSTSDNDQLKVNGKDYMNVKCETSVCMWYVLQQCPKKQKAQSFVLF